MIELGDLADEEVLARLRRHVGRGNIWLAGLLAYLAEVDARRLYAEQACTSTWDFCVRKLGIAMIDCDLYESTVDVFRFLRGRLRDKSILVMDDWNCFGGDDNLGQRLALREFLASEPGLQIEPLCGYGANSQAFVVSRRLPTLQ